MTFTVSITSQGQISIPAQIRKQLGLYKKKQAIVSIENNKMTVEPVKDFLEMGGSLKTNKKPLSSDKVSDFFAQSVAKEYKNNK
jgi:AbrB family looped-hinge helix DNA binding protein